MSKVVVKADLVEEINSLELEIKSSQSMINHHRKQIVAIETKIIGDLIALNTAQEKLRLLVSQTVDRSMTDRQKEIQEFVERRARAKDCED